MINSILDYLEQSAKKFPEKVFLSSKKEHITYTQFVEQSKKLATQLLKFNTKNKPYVVYAAQDLHSLIIFFGILYSGNFYVPVGVDNPKERLTAILENVYQNEENKIIIGHDEEGYFIESFDDGFENSEISRLNLNEINQQKWYDPIPNHAKLPNRS